MSFESLKEKVITRLDDADRGDRGWFIITRVHVSTNWIKGIVDYIFSKGQTENVSLNLQDYSQLARVVGIGSQNPGVQLRRHHLLVLEKPLQLIQRLRERSWQHGIRLTKMGVELANSNDPAIILEETLREVVFAEEPWSPPDRVAQYSDFKVQVYEATIEVVDSCDGYIDRDEFDLFLARVRDSEEVDSAIDNIMFFRELNQTQKVELLEEVRARIPSSKPYQNWRDMDLHTFSLFGLGTSLVRDGKMLLSADTWADEHLDQTDRRISAVPDTTQPELRVPEPPGNELLVPPASPAANDGTDGESFVAKIFRSKGWNVSFYTNKRGYGFDLWAHRGESALVIEVKSSLGQMGTVTMTSHEYLAAQEYGDNFILAIVEDLGTDTPSLALIQNPLEKLDFQASESVVYRISRADWSYVL